MKKIGMEIFGWFQIFRELFSDKKISYLNKEEQKRYRAYLSFQNRQR